MFPRDAVVEERGRTTARYEEDASRRDALFPGRRRIDDSAGAARDRFERRGERIVDCAADAVPQRCGQRSVDCRGTCLLYTSPSPRDGLLSRMPSSA